MKVYPFRRTVPGSALSVGFLPGYDGPGRSGTGPARGLQSLVSQNTPPAHLAGFGDDAVRLSRALHEASDGNCLALVALEKALDPIQVLLFDKT